MVSASEASFNLRESLPLPRNILHTRERDAHRYTGQRTSPRTHVSSTGYQTWLLHSTKLKVSAGYLNYPADVRDTAKSGMGYRDNCHLNDLAESIFVNVGGSYWNVKASSLPMSDERVGGAIVLGAWESHVHGKGHQEKDVPLYLITATAPGIVWDEPQGAGCERERDDKTERNLRGGMSISGEPGAGAPRGVWK
jgi:hypothetical protein